MTATELAGAVDGLDEATYHAHPALSASGAKRLLPPSCPALYRWERDHGEPPKRVFELGRAAHAQVLGVGGEIVIVQKTAKDKTVVDAEDYLTKSAQDHRDEIRASGLTPLLRRELAQVQAMAAALRAHPDAARLFHPDTGRPEVSAFWEDWAHGVSRRFRTDWMSHSDGGRITVVDYKSCPSAEPTVFAKAAHNLGYPLQQVFYTDGIRALELADDVDFLFVAQERTPPYLVQVFRLDPAAVRIGRRRVDEALRVFAECEHTGVWPGYAQGVTELQTPVWLARDEDDDDPWSGL